jgi:hypothetical protein
MNSISSVERLPDFHWTCCFSLTPDFLMNITLSGEFHYFSFPLTCLNMVVET